MKSKILITGLLVLLAGCTGAGITRSDTLEDLEAALGSGKPVLLDLYATWCTPCKFQAPIMEDLKEEYEGTAVVLSIDVDQYPGIINQYNPRNTVPTLVVFDRQGRVYRTYVGQTEKDELAAALQEVMGNG
jgi:thioredoxin 1